MLKPNIPLPCKTGNRQMKPILVTYKTTLFFLFLHIHHYLQIHKLLEKKKSFLIERSQGVCHPWRG